MNQSTSCRECKDPITGHGFKCVNCSDFFQKEIFYCERCSGTIEHEKLRHCTVSIDNTQTTNDRLFNSVIQFEQLHLQITTNLPKPFPYNDLDSVIWKRNLFLDISYRLLNEMPFKDSIPFVCDYLRMNNSLKSLADKLNLKLCSTDIIILILKYSSYETRLFVIEQLCMFQRPIPVYLGTPSRETSSMKYYFLMHEMLHLLLPYTHQKILFVLSFGTSSCQGKTLLLNTILKTNFDCHRKGEFNSELASSCYHHQLIQIVIGHRYSLDRDAKNEIIRNYYCHAIDVHGNHNWKQMPSFFIEFMSVIIIHIDILDRSQLASFAWPSVTFNQTATYLIFIHGEISETELKTTLQPQILEYFGSNKTNVHVIRATALVNENDKIVQLGVLNLLKEAPIPRQSLLNVSDQWIQKHNINLSTSVDRLLKSKQLLDEFDTIVSTLSKDSPSLDLFPLSRLQELSDKTDLSITDRTQKDQLTEQLHQRQFNKAHLLLTRLTQFSIDDDSNLALFEKAIILWNAILWQHKENVLHTPPLSIIQCLDMSKERFLRELQERSKGYTNLNGIHCWFNDSVQMKEALVKIYQRSFRDQEYIEIINARSSVIYPEIFQETFSNDSEDLKNFFVVGIIGEQSGGKSFLINKTFGTKIAESKFKCTTGILATRVNIIGHPTVKNIVILDTEGLLDQSKRTDEAQIFDRKIVLAMMARSHLVMINITRNVNKTMQHILEVVMYGLNKLQITNKPKVIFVFRDQDPKTMDETKQRNYVSEVMRDIQKSCTKVSLDVQTIINGFDIHEFPSPFVDLYGDEKEISFFTNSFCQKALSLRMKIIDHLANSTSFDSFNEWLVLILNLWQQINYNSNLFDYESLLHLTLDKELEAFCNRLLTKMNSRLSEMVDRLMQNERNRLDNPGILSEIKEQLNDMEKTLVKSSLDELVKESGRLMRRQNLEFFPEDLFKSTTSRIETTLNMYKTDNYIAVARQLQQDEFQKKLSEIPKQLSRKIHEMQSVSEYSAQFETLFDDSSKALLEQFSDILMADYKNQSVGLRNQLIDAFVKQLRIDQVGVKYFRQYLENETLIGYIRRVIVLENVQQKGEQSMTIINELETSASRYGQNIFRTVASSIGHLYYSKAENTDELQMKLESMLSVLRTEHSDLRNSPYYDKNLLPIPDVANYCVRHIGNAIERHKITDQSMKNTWYTSYGIMLNIFCNEHYDYITAKLIYEFKREISRRKEEVRQIISNASTAEEHGQALVKHTWTVIQNDIQKQHQDKFERFFATWNDYYPSIISEHCVNQLFRSEDYQAMFRYIQDPTASIKEWLRSKFNAKYQSQLNQTLLALSSHLENTKNKLRRMFLSWHAAIQVVSVETPVVEVTQSLMQFLSTGKYVKLNIYLNEEDGGFAILKSTATRQIPSNADKHRLLKAIFLMFESPSVDACVTQSSENSLVDDNMKKSTKNLLNDHQWKDRLFDRFYNKAKGCGIPCPYCKQICDSDNPMHTEHRTDHHLLLIFRGYREVFTEQPAVFCCSSNDVFERKVRSLREEEKDIYLPFPDHIKQFNPMWKIINKMTLLEDFQLKAYIALEEDLSKHYHYKGRVDDLIRKRFLRATVTSHCYGLLVGIDYGNTPYSLDGIPSYDVSCIEEQLNLSSIAHPENLHILKNNEATKESILNELRTIVNNMDERATFIFYFSGHGNQTTGSEPYLLTSDFKKLTAKKLADVIDKAKTNKIIIILDSCYSGGLSNAFCYNLKNYKQGIHILCSSGEAQQSQQSVDDRNGFFTKYLIKGLRGEFSCERYNCNECATRTENLQKASIRKVTSTELVTYLTHAVTKRQQFTYTTVNGSDFDISFLN